MHNYDNGQRVIVSYTDKPAYADGPVHRAGVVEIVREEAGKLLASGVHAHRLDNNDDMGEPREYENREIADTMWLLDVDGRTLTPWHGAHRDSRTIKLDSVRVYEPGLSYPTDLELTVTASFTCIGCGVRTEGAEATIETDGQDEAYGSPILVHYVHVICPACGQGQSTDAKLPGQDRYGHQSG